MGGIARKTAFHGGELIPYTMTTSRAAYEQRERVLDHLQTIVDAFPDLPIDAPSMEGLDSRDAALARAIDGAVRRRWLSLRGVVSSFLQRPFDLLDAPARAALLVGTAQLLLLDRIPDHAAIDSTVGWTKRHHGRGVSGLVNAVLRNVARRRDVAPARRIAPMTTSMPSLNDRDLPLPDGRLLGDMLPSATGAERLSIQCSLAPSLVESWIAHAGEAAVTHRALCSIVPAPTIVRFDRNGEAPEGLLRHERDGFAIHDPERGALSEYIDQARGRWVQDPGAAAALELVATVTPELSPALVLDLCAGRGTKTRQLAAMFPHARIVASDPDLQRLASLRAVFRDDPRVTVSTDREADALGVGAQLVVVDVPCSNSGVLARRLEARYRHGHRRQQGLVALQREILARAFRLVADGGVVLYATCSLEPEENAHPWSELAARAGRGHTDILRCEERLPAGLPGESPTRHLDGGGTTLIRVHHAR